MTEPPEIFFTKSPLYAVLFSSSQDVSEPYSPYVEAPRGVPIFKDDAHVTAPHGLSKEMADALPGLWYCVHLPNIFPQLVDIPFTSLEDGQSYSLDHQIFFAPVQLFNRAYIAAWPPWVTPALAVCPDDILEEVRENAIDLGFALPAVGYSELSDDSLKAHWREIHAFFAPTTPYLGYEPTLTKRLDLSPTSLPARWLARQISYESAEELNEDVLQLIRKAQSYQIALVKYADRERAEHENPDSTHEMPQATESQNKLPRAAVTLALPGIATAYSRQVYSFSTRNRIEPMMAIDDEDTWSPEMAYRRDSMIERATIELLAAHRAIAQTGIGLMLPSVSRDVFVALAKIEDHFTASKPSGPVVTRLLAQLDAAASSVWTDALIEAVGGASKLTIFSNFPFGLIRYPGDSSPLATRLPITYLPLNPLSQAMQRELTYTPSINLSQGFGVLVAECIPSVDPVGAVSRSAWGVAQTLVQDGGYPIDFKVAETLSVADLRSAIEETAPAILVISAHGAYRIRSNLAGLIIGDQICLGPELGDLPPVVILSACHVAPRGAGAVGITDILLRQGALAVLGTQVPVDVGHNAILLTRLFLYLAETLARREDYSTLLDAWHHVQTSNAVNDILYGNSRLRDWGLRHGRDGSWILGEFMDSKSRGRIRRGYVYQDTEGVLGEMADERGLGEKVRNWFRNPGYMPESLFYVFAGMPDRVHLM